MVVDWGRHLQRPTVTHLLQPDKCRAEIQEKKKMWKRNDRNQTLEYTLGFEKER